MKLTKSRLKQIIKEEIQAVISEEKTRLEPLSGGRYKAYFSNDGITGVAISKSSSIAQKNAYMDYKAKAKAASAPSQAAAKAPQAKPAQMPQQRAAKGSAPMPNVVGKANQVSSDIEKFKRMIAQDGVVTAGEKAKLDKLSKGVKSVKKQAAKPAPSGPKYDPNDRRSINAAFKNKKISKDEWRKARRALARKSKAAARQIAQQQVSKVQKFMGLNEEGFMDIF